MKKLALAAAAATLLAGPALAQTNNQPSYQTGSGQAAGGPANELNPSRGLPGVLPARPTDNQPSYQTGGGQAAGGPANELNPSRGLPPGSTTGSVRGGSDNQPSYQTGSGQAAGGPANELNPSRGVPATGATGGVNEQKR